jgi:exosortase E/protease (VPEID-CTERM system)
VRAKNTFQQISSDLKRSSIRWSFLPGHVSAFLVFLGLLLLPLGNNPSDIYRLVMAVMFSAAGVLAIVLCLFVFVPPKAVAQLLRATGFTWLHALLVGLIALSLLQSFPLWNEVVWRPEIDLSWKPATDLTFGLVKRFLCLFLSNVVADRATMTIGNPTFRVEILPGCTGFEGTALMLVFAVSWLWFMRREFRFPQALVLIPVGMSVIWLANAVRITALILIGVAGAPGVAVDGFHSQAGWIAFNCVALSLAALSLRIPWFAQKARTEPEPNSVGHDPTIASLMPFLVILAAAMLSRAVSDGFEWFYPLRFFAAAATLWYFRTKYAELDWKFSWVSVVCGVAVFAIWLGLDRFTGSHVDNGIASGLASMPRFERIAWLVFRTAAACITVPIAEELAFRYFLIRRVITADFESLGPRKYTLISVLISSLAFGLLHGDRWIAGTVSGLLYAAVFLRRGRIGDAVAAHATTNGLLAALVLQGGKWYLW